MMNDDRCRSSSILVNYTTLACFDVLYDCELLVIWPYDFKN